MDVRKKMIRHRYCLSGEIENLRYRVTGNDIDMLRLEAADRLRKGFTAKIYDTKLGREVKLTLEGRDNGANVKKSK